jgi:hypothetical protein
MRTATRRASLRERPPLLDPIVFRPSQPMRARIDEIIASRLEQPQLCDVVRELVREGIAALDAREAGGKP